MGRVSVVRSGKVMDINCWCDSGGVAKGVMVLGRFEWAGGIFGNILGPGPNFWV